MKDCKALQERLQEVRRLLRSKCPAFELVEPENNKASTTTTTNGPSPIQAGPSGAAEPTGMTLVDTPIPFTPEFKSPKPPNAPSESVKSKTPQHAPKKPA